MVCFRSRRLAAGLFVCSVVLGACGKKDEGGAAGGKSGASAASTKDLEMIPVESEIVLGVDLAQAQKSALFRDLAAPEMTASGDIQKIVETLKTKCDIDPMKAATSLTAGVKDASTRNPEVVAVLHGIEKAKAMPCLDKVKDDLAAEKLEVVKDGDVVVIKSDRGDLAFTFTGDTTAVIVAGPNAKKERVLEIAQAKSTLKSSKQFNEMFGRVQAGHTAWAVVNGGTPIVAKNLQRLEVTSKALVGSVNVTDKLEIHGRALVENADQAQKLAETVKMLASFAGKSEKLEVEPENAEVRLLVVFTQPQLEQLLKRAKSLR